MFAREPPPIVTALAVVFVQTNVSVETALCHNRTGAHTYWMKWPVYY
jgi:hypothetical protein